MPHNRAAADESPSSGRPTGDPLWYDCDTPLRVPAMPVLHLDGLEGPMDLVLDLAERQRIDLGRISVAALVEQFVAESARVAPYVPIERRAEWLVLAIRLVLLRSRLLFPASPEAEADAEREAEWELARLAEMRLVRAATAWLAPRPQLGHDVLARPPPGPDPCAAS
jgi:segregation and condensation protein A